jgi:hypothetical protein
MKKGIAVRIALAAGTTLALAHPAGATHSGIHPLFFAERVYFQCEGESKLQNPTLPAPWTTMTPSATIQNGEIGCIASDPAAEAPPSDAAMESDAVFDGTFTGNIRNLTVKTHILGHSGQSVQSGTVPIEVSLDVDGQQVVSEVPLSLPTDTTPSYVLRSVEFTVADMGCAREVRDADGDVIDVVTGGMATEDGYGSAQHNVHLELAYAGAVNANRVDHITWLWGSQEMGSGIQFNDATPAVTTIQPATPATCP